MINKRLLCLMADSKKYIGYTVIWQWIGLMATIGAMTAAAQLIESSLYAWVFQTELPKRRIVISLVLFATAILCRALSSRETAEASAKAGSEVRERLRFLLYKKLCALGASYHEKVPTAGAVQVAVEGTEQLEIYFGRYLPQLIYSAIAPVTLFAALSFVSFKASLVLLVCVPLIPLTIMGVQKLAKRLLGEYWGVYAGLGECFLENLQGLTALKIYQADQEKAEEMDRQAESFRKITMRVLMMQLNSIIVMDVVAYGGAAAGMLTALVEYGRGNVGISGMLTIIFLSAEFFIPMRLLGSYFHIAMNGMAAADRLFHILDLEEEPEGRADLLPGPLNISLEHVTFSYGNSGGRPALKDVSLRFPERGLVSLAGASGCGKSTASALITGQNRGYEGKILINGEELSCISEKSLMSRITLVGHNSYLFRGTVEDNLRMAAPQAGEEELYRVLKEVRLYDYVMSRDGLLTEVAERGENLSGGQRQRLALARALLHDTEAYVFDEAASNIDAESEDQIMEVIKRLSESRLVILISHRLANVVDSDLICVLENGILKEQGTHRELLERDGVYSRLYSGQMELEAYGKGGKADESGKR